MTARSDADHSFYGNRHRQSFGTRKGNTRFVVVGNSDTRPITRFLHYRAGGKTGQQKRQGHHNHADLQKTPRDGWLGLKPKLCLYRRRGSRGAKILKHSTLRLPTSRESSKKEYADGKPRIPRSESQTLSTALLEAERTSASITRTLFNESSGGRGTGRFSSTASAKASAIFIYWFAGSNSSSRRLPSESITTINPSAERVPRPGMIPRGTSRGSSQDGQGSRRGRSTEQR